MLGKLFDKILDVLSRIAPTNVAGGIFGDMLFGRGIRFRVRREIISGWAVDRMLAKKGIRIWGRGYEGDYLYFKVKHAQEDWARYVLRGAGLPFRASADDDLLL